LDGGYVFSLSELPEFPVLGWRLGKGRSKKENLDVDLLLMDSGSSEDEIGGIHALFQWVSTGGGFFLVAKSKPIYFNGEVLVQDQRLIPHQNMIGIGNHLYHLEYSQRSSTQEIEFQAELEGFFSVFHAEKPPIIQPTPTAQTQQIGDYVLGHPIANRSFSNVFAATHKRNSIPAAVKLISKTRGNSHVVERELEITRLLKDQMHVCVETRVSSTLV
jgi:hypothetical protein